MINSKSSYKSIAKSTILFGGVKIVEVLVTILRTKLVAILLGPEGMGIQSIFQSTLAFVNQFSTLGLFQSSVRYISQAFESKDEKKIARIIKIINHYVWLVAVLGVLLLVVGANLFSNFNFGNTDYTWQFIVLSLASAFWALSSGNITIMQGCRQLNSLARASLLGASLSLFTSLPLYYLFGSKGIAPALVMGFITTYIVNSYYLRKIKFVNAVDIKCKEIFSEGKAIVKLGIVLMFSNILMSLFVFLTNSFISNYGNLADVGFFQAAFSVTNQNIIIIVSVMAADFFPRLSAVFDDDIKVKELLNQQAEFISLIIGPISILVILLAPFIVKLLFSSKFIIIIPMLRWMALALLFRGVWLTMSYVILAKGDRKTYFIYDALLGNGISFLLNICAYYFYGLQGLGVSFVVGSIFVTILLSAVLRFKYDLNYSISFLKVFMVLLTMSIFSYLINISLTGYIYVCAACVIAIIVFGYSFYILNKRIGIKEFVCSKIK